MSEPITRPPNYGEIRCEQAANLLEHHVGLPLYHPDSIVRLVQFSHDSPGLRVIKRRVAEALVMLIEANGMLICNGLDDAVGALEQAGYTVAKDTPEHAPTSTLEGPKHG